MQVPRHFRPIIAFAGWVIILAPLAFGQPSFQGLGHDEKTFSAEELFAKISPSVVKIVTLDGRVLIDGRVALDHERTIGSGSGFLLDIGNKAGTQNDGEWKGYVVTSFHVIRGAYDATIQFGSEQTGKVTSVLAENRVSDIAILQVTSPHQLGHPLKLDLVSTPLLEGRSSRSEAPRVCQTLSARG